MGKTKKAGVPRADAGGKGGADMLLEQERAQVVRYSKMLMERGLTRGTGGNISIRSGGYVAITPSGVEYSEMTPADVVVTDLAHCVRGYSHRIRRQAHR